MQIIREQFRSFLPLSLGLLRAYSGLEHLTLRLGKKIFRRDNESLTSSLSQLARSRALHRALTPPPHFIYLDEHGFRHTSFVDACESGDTCKGNCMQGGCIKDSRTRGRDKALQRRYADTGARRARIMHTVNYFRAIEQRIRGKRSGKC